MFNLDDFDVDFNDDIFDDFKSKSSLNLNVSSDRGTLSFGIGTSSDKRDEIYLPKRLCLENPQLQSQISILSKANDTQSIKDYQEKHSNTLKLQSLIHKNISPKHDNDSPSYSPITSTQKERNSSNMAYLFDSTNKISPIKIKPGICSELRKPGSLFPTDKSSHGSVKNSSNCQKFPGPAGNLPKVSNHNFHSVQGDNKFTKIQKPERSNINTQKSRAKDFSNYSSQIEYSETWKMTRQILGNNRWMKFQKYNLENVFKKNKEPNGLPNSKIPIICLVLSEIEYMPMDAVAILSDETGSIRCAIHRQVLETYSEKLKTGSVLILKKVSIFSPSGKKYYFNITKSNIAEIISPGDEDWENRPLISEAEIEHLITECSEIPKIIFNPESLLKGTTTGAAVSHLGNPQIAPPIIPDRKQIEFFDDEMDEFLVSFMDESFGGDNL